MRSPLIPRHGGRSRRRLLALIAAPALGLSLLAATPSPAVTTDGLDETAAPDAPVEDFESLTADAEPVAVTLITGDTVLWSDAGDGNSGVVEIEEGPREYPVHFDQSGTQKDFYVIPYDVMPRVVDGTLDRELFNIPGLIRQGLDDASTGGELPVIVTFEKPDRTRRAPAGHADAEALANKADALPATEDPTGVERIHGAGVSIDRDKAAAFRDAVLTTHTGSKRPPNTAAAEDMGAGMEHILLDQMLQIDLDESVPQIGAPAAWEAGYTGEGVTVAVLDTGVDATHHDLQGQVVAEANFTDEPDASDNHGHGTHVASTIAGTGAASDGLRKGVAPDAELLSGKVCDANGECQTSWIMAGMQWAADQGADVVNMSLGGAATDGTDPLSQLLNELSAETGTLFVTSAGNVRRSIRAVGTPAAADAALAVGAVDKADQRAGFSSRGPRAGDHAVKPEITAPGVGIVAARADGTSLGTPVDDDYTSSNGTSMAAPHVTGAAALLAQATSLSGAALKDALVSTATSTSPLGPVAGTITSGPYEGTTFTMTFASDTPPIDGVISGTPTFVGDACDPLEAGEGIALVERGPSSDPCTFQEKLDHITRGGYEAAIEFNQPGADCLQQTFMEASGTIPFMSVSRLVGLQLLQEPELTTANACATESPSPGSQVASTTIGRQHRPGYRWYEQGTGRVDVPVAIDSPVYATGTVNLGGIDDQATGRIVYTNRTTDDITLALRAEVTDLDGQPATGVSLSTDTLTVPAHGTANVTVTAALDVSDLAGNEAFGGVVTATADGVSVRTAIGYGAPLHRVTIHVLDSHGNPTGSPTAPDFSVNLTNDTPNRDDSLPESYVLTIVDGTATGHLPTGIYTIMTTIQEHKPEDSREYTRMSLLVEVEVEIAKDTAITLDARQAEPIEVSVPRKTDKRNHGAQIIRTLVGGDGQTMSKSSLGGKWPLYATPAPPGKLAPVGLFVTWTLAEPQPLLLLPSRPSGECLRYVAHNCYSRTPAYIYNLPILYENGIPNNLHRTVTRDELVEVPTRFHSDHADALVEQVFEIHMHGVGVIGDMVKMFFRPGAVTEYFLADDRLTWKRSVAVQRRLPGQPLQGFLLFSEDRFSAAESGSRRAEERWHEGPLRLGTWDIREESLANPTQLSRYALASRDGPNNEWFIVPMQALDSTRGHGGLEVQRTPTWHMWNMDTGAELDGNGLLFPLVDGTATYRLEQQVANVLPSLPFITGREITTVWTFTSHPSDEQVPQKYECPTRENICQIQPLIRLEYDLGLDIHNRMAAGRAHRFTVTAGQHSKAVDRSPVTSLTVEASFDGGETWTDARVMGKPKDTWDTGGFLPAAEPYQEFRVVLRIPPLHRTTGFVSLRVQAEDANGGTVEETISRAYILKESKRGRQK